MDKPGKEVLLPLPIGQFFQIHGSKFKLHPVCHLGQASVLCITHRVLYLFFCVGVGFDLQMLGGLGHSITGRKGKMEQNHGHQHSAK